MVARITCYVYINYATQGPNNYYSEFNACSHNLQPPLRTWFIDLLSVNGDDKLTRPTECIQLFS